MRRTIPLIILLPWLVLTGCPRKDIERNAYAALLASQTSYNRLTDMTYEQFTAGKISPEKFDKAAELFEKWGTAHNAAVSALEVYHVTGEKDDALKLLTAISIMNEVLDDVRALLRSFGALDEEVLK